MIMARTDSLAVEGLEKALERVTQYVANGADLIFAEAVTDLETYRRFVEVSQVPVLANITEFGQTPLFTVEELAGAGVSLALYPLTAFRAMSAAALAVYENLRREGSQKSSLSSMQTRAELYEILGYYAYEQKLDQLFKREQSK